MRFISTGLQNNIACGFSPRLGLVRVQLIQTKFNAATPRTVFRQQRRQRVRRIRVVGMELIGHSTMQQYRIVLGLTGYTEIKHGMQKRTAAVNVAYQKVDAESAKRPTKIFGRNSVQIVVQGIFA